jgi:hypothetical protein
MAIEFDPSADNAAIGLEIAELALNLTTGDLLIPPKIIRGAEAVAQRVRVRFRWFLGEWFLDERLGVPYYSDILVKNPDPILISFIFRRVLLSTPGVKSVSSFSATLDRTTRTLLVDFEATLDNGIILTAVAEPFIISG